MARPSIALHHGDRISFQGKLHHPRGSLNPGGFDYAAYIERQGIDFLATVTGAQAVTLLEAETQSGYGAYGTGSIVGGPRYVQPPSAH